MTKNWYHIGIANSAHPVVFPGRSLANNSVFMIASSSRTAARSVLAFHTSAQSLSAFDPGAAPITSNIHSAGFADGGHLDEPFLSK